MAGFTDALEKLLLDHIFTDPLWTPETTLYLSLFSATPSDDAGTSLVEVSTSSTGYARIATTAADWSAASGTAPAVKTNTATKTFGTALTNWASGANLTNFGIHSAITAGTLYAVGLLGTAKPVLTGDTPAFGAGGMILKLGDPGDTY